MSAVERHIRNQLVRYAQLVYQKGWVANHDGNLTVRQGRGRIVATPTSYSKGQVGLDDLLVVNEHGERIAGHTRPFSELALHLAIYGAREDAMAVVHAHPPFATAMACAGVGLEQPFMPEAVVSLGDRIPLVSFAAPKTPEFTANLEPWLPFYDAVMLENHGVIAWGDNLEQAFLRLELVEHLATIATHARPWGGVQPLDSSVVARLMDARTRAGLGPEARGVTGSRPASPAQPGARSHSRPNRHHKSEMDVIDAVTREVLSQLASEQK